MLVSGVSGKLSWQCLAGGLAGFLFLSFRRGRAFSAPASRDANPPDEPYFSLVKLLLTMHKTTTYQQAQGQLAIASGGLFGQGFNT